MTLRRISVLAVVVVAAAAGGVAAAAGIDGQWAWVQGDSKASVGEPAGSSDLVLTALGAIDFSASHVRLISRDGTFALVHANDGPAVLNAYYLGTPTRTPIQIGAPAGVTPLIVAGSAGQSADLQQWQLGGRTVAAIDGRGLLRLGSVTLDPVLDHGRVKLYAITAKGRQLLATGVPAK